MKAEDITQIVTNYWEGKTTQYVSSAMRLGTNDLWLLAGRLKEMSESLTNIIRLRTDAAQIAREEVMKVFSK